MISLKIIKKQILILLFLSILLSVIAIIHGIFFDLDITQIKRLTFGGVILTLFVVFPLIIIIEYVFDINNKKEIENINNKINKLKKRK